MDDPDSELLHSYLFDGNITQLKCRPLPIKVYIKSRRRWSEVFQNALGAASVICGDINDESPEEISQIGYKGFNLLDRLAVSDGADTLKA